jgi:hypothetical protein
MDPLCQEMQSLAERLLSSEMQRCGIGRFFPRRLVGDRGVGSIALTPLCHAMRCCWALTIFFCRDQTSWCIVSDPVSFGRPLCRAMIRQCAILVSYVEGESTLKHSRFFILFILFIRLFQNINSIKLSVIYTYTQVLS